MANAWQPYVQAAQAISFTKVCIIARANYQTLATSNPQTDIATAYKLKQMNDKMEEVEVDVNENQELLNDWKDTKVCKTFAFFGQKFNVILRDEDDGSFLVCSKGKEVCIARQFKTIWFICYGPTQKQTKENKGKSFSAARSAWNLVCKTLFDSLEENGV